MCIRVCRYRTVKSLENQRIVVPVADHAGSNAAIAEVQNCAEIDFVDLNAFIPLEFRYVGKPLFIRLVRMKVPIKQIPGHKLRILCLSGAAVAAVLDGGLDALGTANPENTLVVYMNVVVMPEIVIDAAVTLVWAFRVDLLDFLCNLQVLHRPITLFS